MSLAMADMAATLSVSATARRRRPRAGAVNLVRSAAKWQAFALLPPLPQQKTVRLFLHAFSRSCESRSMAVASMCDSTRTYSLRYRSTLNMSAGPSGVRAFAGRVAEKPARGRAGQAELMRREAACRDAWLATARWTTSPTRRRWRPSHSGRERVDGRPESAPARAGSFRMRSTWDANAGVSSATRTSRPGSTSRPSIPLRVDTTGVPSAIA